MKRILQLGILFATMMAFGAAVAQTSIVFTWTNGNTGSTALPVCPATSPKACASGFTLSMDGTQIAGPSSIGPTVTTYTQTPLPAVGSHSYSIVMNGFDATGAAIQSTAATATVNVPAPVVIPPPTGLKVTLQ
jgi:hypothetical protein